MNCIRKSTGGNAHVRTYLRTYAHVQTEMLVLLRSYTECTYARSYVELKKKKKSTRTYASQLWQNTNMETMSWPQHEFSNQPLLLSEIATVFPSALYVRTYVRAYARTHDDVLGGEPLNTVGDVVYSYIAQALTSKYSYCRGARRSTSPLSMSLVLIATGTVRLKSQFSGR